MKPVVSIYGSIHEAISINSRKVEKILEEEESVFKQTLKKVKISYIIGYD